MLISFTIITMDKYRISDLSYAVIDIENSKQTGIGIVQWQPASHETDIQDTGSIKKQ